MATTASQTPARQNMNDIEAAVKAKSLVDQNKVLNIAASIEKSVLANGELGILALAYVGARYEVNKTATNDSEKVPPLR